MTKKFQVFVSSTFIDLEDERRAVIEAILDLKHIPIGMEAFQAGDDDQWTYIKKRIDEADYYVVIVAERYGSEKDGKSYTEMEYDYARAKGVPVAAFLLADEARVPWRAEKAKFVDTVGKIDAFRAKCQGKLCKPWRNKDDLALACTKTLALALTDELPGGWIPAKEAPDTSVLNELARLSKENEELREKLQGLDGDREVEEVIGVLSNNKVDGHINCTGYTLLDLFNDISDRLIDGIDTYSATDMAVYMNFSENSIAFGYCYDDKLYVNITDNIRMLIVNLVVSKSMVVFDKRASSIVQITDFGKRVLRRFRQSIDEGQASA